MDLIVSDLACVVRHSMPESSRDEVEVALAGLRFIRRRIDVTETHTHSLRNSRAGIPPMAEAKSSFLFSPLEQIVESRR